MNFDQSSVSIALKIHSWSKKLLSQWGVAPDFIDYFNLLILGFYLIVLMFAMDFLIRKIVLKVVLSIIRKSPAKFDDYLANNKTFIYLSRAILLILSANLISTVFIDFPAGIKPVKKCIDLLLVINWYFFFRAILRSVRDHLYTKSRYRDKPLGSYLQVANMVLIFIISIVIFTLLTGLDVWKFLGAFGAASAIVMLVFKDTILGFVASIQVSVNDMVRIGDWIEMPKYGADGDVLEINLNTVKIQNFDKTITTVPTYYLVTDSFKNWRGMQRAGGRRIKRPLKIKMSSIRFMRPEEIEKLKKIQLLTSFIEQREVEIAEHNKVTGADPEMPVNGRNFTNIGLFRAYVSQYLKNNVNLRQDMTMLVRQLEPTAEGLPLEIYVFTASTAWDNYENTMSNIFDHLFASIKYFGLEVFESPSSADIRSLQSAEGETQAAEQ